MSDDYYSDPEDFATWMEAVADDAGYLVRNLQNQNDRSPVASWLLGVEFACRYAAYEARRLEVDSDA